MKKPSYIFLGFTLVSLLFSNCTTTEIPLDEPVVPIVELVTYNTDVKTIIDNNCIGCHNDNGQASFLPLVNYTQVKNAAENGPLIARMNNQTAPMPQSGLLPAQIRAIVDEWKVDGFLEN